MKETSDEFYRREAKDEDFRERDAAFWRHTPHPAETVLPPQPPCWRCGQEIGTLQEYIAHRCHTPHRTMRPIVVHLHEIATGRKGIHRDLGHWVDGEFNPFIWQMGNYGCDCNRALFLARALGEPEPADENLTCSNERIRVRIETVHGEMLYTDEP